MNGHFTGFYQGFKNYIEGITPFISSLQGKHNEWSLYRVSSTGSKVRMSVANYFHFSRQTK